jgi:diguanylate cyclase (GGDEF)-like protein/putative nucleotidyltransferase with HDIG domain
MNYEWQVWKSLVGWPTMLTASIGYMMLRFYRLYHGRLQAEQRHAQEISSLHMRTIEALALAIEAKDENTHDHLERVRLYCVEIGREFGLSSAELEALEAASLLHDIGKLAIPEHIISKPGRLSKAEFEKMKTHPVVGAEILERVDFPYPVAPIVRAHHEKWDGSGYPRGLKAEQIPIGARILSAVDFVDALASDRQYRLSLPLDDVLMRLQADSGRAFDPNVVRLLVRRFAELESKVRVKVRPSPGLTLPKTRAQAAARPAAAGEEGSEGTETTFLSLIAAARQEAQTLFELAHDLGASLSLSDTLSMLAVKMQRLVPYDTMVVYVRRDDVLVPEHAGGDEFRLFAALRIPLGEGLSGWVAQQRKPVLNGNPALEFPAQEDGSTPTALRSALVVPLEGVHDSVGALALYKAEAEAFNVDHLRVLQAIRSKTGMAVENSLRYQQAESSATTDYVTGLPNARSLFVSLEHEVNRSRRTQSVLAVMVGDLDGFKQINDRFGHLMGNQVLRLFAERLRQACREYDHVARMGGDEFVVLAPDLPLEAARAKALTFSDLARQAAKEICGEDFLGLSVGIAVFPADGEGAETLLAEADRRMYQEKQNRPWHPARRRHARVRVSIPVELRAESLPEMVWGSLLNLSEGGCFVETLAVLAKGEKLEFGFALQGEAFHLQGTVCRCRPGFGLAVEYTHSKPVQTTAVHLLERIQQQGKTPDGTEAYLELLRGGNPMPSSAS